MRPTQDVSKKREASAVRTLWWVYLRLHLCGVPQKSGFGNLPVALKPRELNCWSAVPKRLLWGAL